MSSLTDRLCVRTRTRYFILTFSTRYWEIDPLTSAHLKQGMALGKTHKYTDILVPQLQSHAAVKH